MIDRQCVLMCITTNKQKTTQLWPNRGEVASLKCKADESWFCWWGKLSITKSRRCVFSFEKWKWINHFLTTDLSQLSFESELILICPVLTDVSKLDLKRAQDWLKSQKEHFSNGPNNVRFMMDALNNFLVSEACQFLNICHSDIWYISVRKLVFCFYRSPRWNSCLRSKWLKTVIDKHCLLDNYHKRHFWEPIRNQNIFSF